MYANLFSLMNIKRLMVKLNQVSSIYIGRIMYALFLMSILETLSFFAILSPSLRMAQSGSNLLASRIIMLVLAFISLCVWLTFQFGFAVMLLRMTRRQHVNLGYIFIGFKCFGSAGKVIFSFAGIFSVLVIIARFAAKFIFSQINPDFSFQLLSIEELQAASENTELISDFMLNTLTFMGIFIVILFLIALCTLIHFVFVFNLHFDNPSLKIPDLFNQSTKLMRKNVFRLIIFAIRAGGKQLLAAIFLAVIVNFIPEEKSSALSILVFLLNIAYFVNLYTAMIRIYLTVPVLYEEIVNGKLKIENS